MNVKQIAQIKERLANTSGEKWRFCSAPKGNSREDYWVEIDTEDASWDALTDEEFEEQSGFICDLQSALPSRPTLQCKNPLNNGYFIAHAKQDVKDLLAYIEELESVVYPIEDDPSANTIDAGTCLEVMRDKDADPLARELAMRLGTCLARREMDKGHNNGV